MNDSAGHNGRALLTAFVAVVLILISARFDFIAGAVPQTSALTAFFRFFSFLGDGVSLIVISAALFASGAILHKKNLAEAGKKTFFSIVTAGIVVQILKAAFERPRISHTAGYLLHALNHPAFLDLTGKYNSFPSGHTTISFAAAFTLGRVYPRLRIPFYLAATLVAASRIYLGSHFPSDVIAGAALGVVVGWLITIKWDTKENRKKWYTAALMLLVVFFSFFKLGGFMVFDVDEAVFSEASREMVETGDVITPTYNYEPRYDKPILIYWFMSTAFRLFGTTEFAARFTSAGFGALLVIMTFLFVKRHRGFPAAALSSVILLLNLEFFVYSHSAVTDMTLAFFISASLFALYTGLSSGEKKFFMLFWLSSAMAVLTKGVIGVLFPMAVAVIYLFLQKKSPVLKKLFNPLYIALFLIAALPWFLVEYHVRGWEFIDAFIIKHHIKRYMGIVSSHSGPFYYYILILLIGFFPWVTLIPGGLKKGFYEWRAGAGGLKNNFNEWRNNARGLKNGLNGWRDNARGLKNGLNEWRNNARGLKNGLNEWRDRAGGYGLYLFTSVWFLFIFLFFSVSSTKLPNYIFPAIPAVSVMCGVYCSDLLEDRKGRRPAFYSMGALSLLISAAFFTTPFLGLKMEIPFPIRFFYLLGAIFLLTAVFSFMAPHRPGRYIAAVASMTAVLLIVLRLYAVPPVNLFFQKDLHTYATYARGLGPGAVLATYEINKPSIAFYSAGRVIKIERNNIKDIGRYAGNKKILLITKKEKYKDIAAKTPLRVIDRRGAYVLMANATGLPPLKD